MNQAFISLIFLAGGVGKRMGTSLPKQFLPLQGKVLARHSFERFLSLPIITEIIVVCEEKYASYFPEATSYALPGKERQHSVARGFEKVSQRCDYVLIHDAARPFVQTEEISTLLDRGMVVGAAALGVLVKSTIKKVHPNQMVQHTLNRSELFEIQTPQLLKYTLLKKGLAAANKNNLTFTDDVALAELLGHPVKIVTGSYQNIKITTVEDFKYATLLCKSIKYS